MRSDPTKIASRMMVKKSNSDQSNLKPPRQPMPARQPLGELTTIYEQLPMHQHTQSEVENPEEEAEVLEFKLILSQKVPAVKLRQFNHKELITNFMKKQKAPTYFLEGHKIRPVYRDKMLDWMIEIFEEYRMNFSSFFFSVSLLDCYLAQTNKTLELTELHKLGLGCIFTASQFNDVMPLNLRNMSEICYQKFANQEIQQMQVQILTTLNFEINIPSTFQFVTLLINIISDQPLIEREMKVLLIELSYYFSKLCLFDYQMQSTFQQSEIAGAVLTLAMLFIYQAHNQFPLSLCFDLVKKNLMLTQARLEEIGKQLELFVNNFPYEHPHCTNVKQYNEHAQGLINQINKLIEGQQ